MNRLADPMVSSNKLELDAVNRRVTPVISQKWLAVIASRMSTKNNMCKEIRAAITCLGITVNSKMSRSEEGAILIKY